MRVHTSKKIAKGLRGFALGAALLGLAGFAAEPLNPATGDPGATEAMTTLEAVLTGEEYREFIADQFEAAEDVYAGHRSCDERQLLDRIGTEIRGEPELDAETGQITSVDLFDKWEAERCGRKIQHNFTLWIADQEALHEIYPTVEEFEAMAMVDLGASFAHEDSVTLIDFTIPGSTLATDEMVANIIARVLDDAEMEHFSGCAEELVIVDTRYAEEVEKIRRSDSGTIRKGKWGEFWTVYGCEREVQYPVILTMNSDSFEIQVFAEDAHQSDF